MANYSTITQQDLFTSFRDNSLYYGYKGKEYLHKGVRHGTCFLSTSLDKMIQSLIQNWGEQKPELKEKLDKIWSYVKHSSAKEEDSLLKSIQKIAFAILISLPTALLIRDFISASNSSGLPSTFTPLGCMNHIFKSYLYVHVMGCLIDYIAKHLDEVPPTESLHIPENLPLENLLSTPINPEV